MANNRLRIKHPSTGLQVTIAKRIGDGWYTPAPIMGALDEFYDALNEFSITQDVGKDDVMAQLILEQEGAIDTCQHEETISRSVNCDIEGKVLEIKVCSECLHVIDAQLI